MAIEMSMKLSPKQAGRLYQKSLKQEERIKKLEEAYRNLAEMFHDQVVLKQAAWIEWKHGEGSESAMDWIAGSLRGPGLIPQPDEPYSTNAQFYYSANKSNPFPNCFCGNPSHQLWMRHGACCDQHMKEIQQAAKNQQKP